MTNKRTEARDERWAKIRELAEKLYTHEEIAYELGISKSTVYNALRDTDYEIPKACAANTTPHYAPDHRECAAIRPRTIRTRRNRKAHARNHEISLERFPIDQDGVRWAPIPGFPDYEISEKGEVYNAKMGRPRKVKANPHGVTKISLYDADGKLSTRSVPLMVADAFVPGKTDIFNTPIHLDGEYANCQSDNLAWRPRWFAIRYHRQFLSEMFHGPSARVIEITSDTEYESIKNACIALGLYHFDIYRSYVNHEPLQMFPYEFRNPDEPKGGYDARVI